VVSSGKLRVALAALGVVLTAQAATPAGAQSRSFGLQQQKALRPLASPSKRGSADGGDAGLDPVAPPENATLMRGPLADTGAAAGLDSPRPGPRKPKPFPPEREPYPKPLSPRTPLPPLEPYASSYVAKKAARTRSATTRGPTPPPPSVTVATAPAIPHKPKPKVEANPYDPLGVTLGSMIFSPYVQASGGFDDNPNRLAPA
jgi:hypothetical protein